MNRKIITFMMVLMMAAWAQGAVSVIQNPGTAPDFFGGPGQDNTSHDIDSIQRRPDNGGYNRLIFGQKGKSNTIKLRQENDYKSNDATICQIGENLSANIKQYADNRNITQVHQFGWDSKIIVKQGEGMQAQKRNEAYIRQMACDSAIRVEQNAGNRNYAEIQQYGGHNKLHITQTASNKRNEAMVTQMAFCSKIEIEQTARGRNYADVRQNGWGSKIDVDQEAMKYNELIIRQGSGCNGNNKIRLDQVSENSYNEAEIDQYGSNNKLVGAGTQAVQVVPCCGCPCFGTNGTVAVVDPKQAATQTAGCFNELDLFQCGSGNTAGLYQNAPKGYNRADIKQFGGGNTVAIYQDNPCGNNDVTVVQAFGATAEIHSPGSVYVGQAPWL